MGESNLCPVLANVSFMVKNITRNLTEQVIEEEQQPAFEVEISDTRILDPDTWKILNGGELTGVTLRVIDGVKFNRERNEEDKSARRRKRVKRRTGKKEASSRALSNELSYERNDPVVGIWRHETRKREAERNRAGSAG